MIQTPPWLALLSETSSDVDFDFDSSVAVAVSCSIEGDKGEEELDKEEERGEGGGWTQYWRMPKAAACTVRQLLLTAGLGTAREGLA